MYINDKVGFNHHRKTSLISGLAHILFKKCFDFKYNCVNLCFMNSRLGSHLLWMDDWIKRSACHLAKTRNKSFLKTDRVQIFQST